MEQERDSLLFNPATHQGLVVFWGFFSSFFFCANVCLCAHPAEVMSSQICCVNKDGTVTAY